MSAEKMVKIAQSQVGYLEKKTNADLDSFSANGGNGNYTKYGRWYGMNPAEWCDIFISWCAAKADEAAAVGKYSYVPSHVSFFRKKQSYYPRGKVTPQPGDIIFFGDEAHVGIVESVSGGLVHTIEGNTKNTAGTGCVMRHSYSLGSSYIMGYGRPAYSDWADWPEIRLFSEPGTYSNGSTEERCYSDVKLLEQTGSLNTWERCKCLGTFGGKYIVAYRKDGTEDYKIGLAAYSGGVE